MSGRDDDDNTVKQDPDAWMGTLSDLVFLLITFFVLLISMSSLDAKKIKKAFGFLDDASAVLNFPKESRGADHFMDIINPLSNLNFPNPVGSLATPDPLARKHAKQLLRNLTDALAGSDEAEGLLGTLHTLAQQSGDAVRIEKTDDGISVLLPGRLIFVDGTEMDRDGVEILNHVATIIQLWGGDIDVIAAWSWHEGPIVLAKTVEVLERNRIDPPSITPQLSPGAGRTIRFVLRRQRSDT